MLGAAITNRILLVSKLLIAGVGVLSISGLFFLLIITFGKPYIPHCYGCHFTEWDALTSLSNQGGLLFTGLIAMLGAACIIWYKLDKRAKKQNKGLQC
jgi:hypothetical protein